MKLEELALLMGKTKQQLIDELKNNDVVELKLTEKVGNKKWIMVKYR